MNESSQGNGQSTREQWKTNDLRVQKLLEISSQEKVQSRKRQEILDALNAKCHYMFRMIESEPYLDGRVLHSGKEVYPFYRFTVESESGVFQMPMIDMRSDLNDLMKNLTILFS